MSEASANQHECKEFRAQARPKAPQESVIRALARARKRWVIIVDVFDFAVDFEQLAGSRLDAQAIRRRSWLIGVFGASVYTAPEGAEAMNDAEPLRVDALGYWADEDVDRVIAALRPPGHRVYATAIDLGDTAARISQAGRIQLR